VRFVEGAWKAAPPAGGEDFELGDGRVDLIGAHAVHGELQAKAQSVCVLVCC
jgi:hypothetical protein